MASGTVIIKRPKLVWNRIISKDVHINVVWAVLAATAAM